MRMILKKKTQPHNVIGLMFCCTGGATRTPDTWFWRPVLYQLSYTRILCRARLRPDLTLIYIQNRLFEYLRYLTGSNCSATFTDSETESDVNSNRIDKVNCNSN